MNIDIPGWKHLNLNHLVLDLNGTLSTDGALITGVAERLQALRSQLSILILTADTRGQGRQISGVLGVPWRKLQGPLSEQDEKAMVVEELGAEHVAAIGNGRNDRSMLQLAGLGIAVMGQEGLAATALSASDLVVGNILDALDLLLIPQRLVATLRC